MTQNKITVRYAEPGDAALMAEIEALSAEQPWNEEQLLDEFGRDFAVLLAASLDGKTVGMLDMHLTGEAYINEISVAPEARRLGAGCALVEEAVRIARKRGQSRLILDVRSGNVAARALYEKAGFRELCIRKNMYRDPPDDGVTYELDLEDPERTDY